MPQSNGKNILKRIEFEFNGKSYNFALNPEEYSQSEPNKATVTQTRGGAFVDQFGAGLVEITLKGTTGFKNGTNDPNNGFEKFKELRDLIRDTYKNTDVNKVMKYYNYTDEEYWYVFVERFTLSRSKSRTLLYQYDIKLTGVRKLSEAAENLAGLIVGLIGNIFAPKNTTVSAKDGGYTGLLNITPTSTSSITVNSQLSPKAQETLVTVTGNLSVVAGGYNGLFSPMIAKYITANMTVLETGDIPNVPSDISTAQARAVTPAAFVFDSANAYETDIELWINGSNLQFDTRVSRGATQLFKELKEFSPSLIETSKFISVIPESLLQQSDTSNMNQIISLIINKMGSSVDSILVDALKADRLQIVQVKQVRIILLEAMNLYRCLYEMASGKSKELGLSEKDVERIINNIIYVTKKLEKLSPIPISTITELRCLHQNICHIQALPELFTPKGGVA